MYAVSFDVNFVFPESVLGPLDTGLRKQRGTELFSRNVDLNHSSPKPAMRIAK